MGAKNVIKIESDEALDRLASRLVELMQEKQASTNVQWINEHEVMDLTGLKSKGAILKLRQEGKIVYTQPFKRVIMYDKKSVIDFLNKHIKETF